MQPDEVKRLYDAEYAASYDAKFLTSPVNSPNTEFELELLKALLADGPEWLDVACGTGYFMQRFPHVRRVGADLSPAMLERARDANPGVALVEHDFRLPRPEWNGRFGLVSCMWYAYTLVDTVREVVLAIDNLSDWTHPAGTCFVPLADARLIARCDLPYDVVDRAPGQTTITGVLWSFTEPGGNKVHAHLVAPQVEFMVEQFQRRFESVRIVRYPHETGEGKSRPALIATRKR